MSLDGLNKLAREKGLLEFKEPFHDYKIYRAKVVDVQDELKSGRVKVWIPDLMFGIPEDDGIWAYPANSPITCSLEDENKLVHDCGCLFIPPKGTFVEVFFEDGDYNKPRYKSGLNLQDTVPIENTYGDEWWNKWTLFKSPKGRMILISDDSTNDEGIIIRGKYLTDKDRDFTGDPRFPNEGRFIVIWEKEDEEYLIMRDNKNQYILIDEANERIRIQHMSGSFIEMKKNGDIIISANRYVYITGEAGVVEQHI